MESTKNSFMEVLSQGLKFPRPKTPFQLLGEHLSRMERAAQAGDLGAWRELAAQQATVFHAAKLSGVRDLEFKIRIKSLELTLMFKAGKRALEEARLLKKQAEEAALTEDASHQDIKLKAEKLEHLGSQLHQQLMAKVA